MADMIAPTGSSEGDVALTHCPDMYQSGGRPLEIPGLQVYTKPLTLGPR